MLRLPRRNRAVQTVAGTARVHIAVVTRQKSTARRLVSSCTGPEVTDQMLCNHDAAVTLRRADQELQFYLAYLDHIEPLRAAGLRFCYPEVSAASKDVHADDTFDLALANKLV